MSGKQLSGANPSVVGIAAVLCSIIGLHLGGLATNLLDVRGSMTLALVALGVVVTIGGAAVGFWICSARGAESDES